MLPALRAILSTAAGPFGAAGARADAPLLPALRALLPTASGPYGAAGALLHIDRMHHSNRIIDVLKSIAAIRYPVTLNFYYYLLL